MQNVYCHRRLTGKEKRVGGFDLLWDDGPIFVEDTGLDYAVAGAPPLNNSFLGEHKLCIKMIIFKIS